MTEVYKLQLGLNNNNVLCYNEDKSKIGEFHVTNEIKELFGDELKIYVEGEMNEQGQISIESITTAEW